MPGFKLYFMCTGLSARERNRLKRMAKSLKRSAPSIKGSDALAKVQSNKRSKVSASHKGDEASSKQVS